jgi:hypothetical protein
MLTSRKNDKDINKGEKKEEEPSKDFEEVSE